MAGQPLYAWDAEERQFLITYDELRRLLDKKVTEIAVTKTLEVYVYGEGVPDDKIKNLRGQLIKIYDGAGSVAIDGYDFKGNPKTQSRTYTEDTTQHPDWTTISSIAMETGTYETAALFDALNRTVQSVAPDESVTQNIFDKAGMLRSVLVENIHGLDTDVVNNIDYDAKGQRLKIRYENGVSTTYEYDEFNFRVRGIRTLRNSDSAVLQDLRYWYDPVGNITLQKDDAQQAIYFDNGIAKPENDYTYDALYRLVQAGGREHAGNNDAPNYNDAGRTRITPVPVAAADTDKMRNYVQYYEYDEVGNFIKMRHTLTGGSGNWTRYYTTDGLSNRLTQTVVGNGTPEVYGYDGRGNIETGFHHLQGMSYNADNRLEQVTVNATRIAYYQYDSGGQRVRKTIIDTNTNIKESRKYVGGWEVYSKFTGSSLTLERETLHVSDDTGRIALVDTRTDTPTVTEQLLRYQYSNHLGSATLELDEVGAVISYEEYYPYGSTSFQSGRSLAEVSLKRYRYTGKERDEESGLYYHGARYYIPWLCRWTAVDPSENKNAGKSTYQYCDSNPVIYVDPDGKDKITFHSFLINRKGITEETDSRADNTGHAPIKTPDTTTSYRWVTIEKNDLPNSYRVEKTEVETDFFGDGAQVATTKWNVSSPNYNFDSNKSFYETLVGFRGILSEAYPTQYEQSNSHERPSSASEIHTLFRRMDEYKKNNEIKEGANSLVLGVIELAASELFVASLLKGAGVLGRFADEGASVSKNGTIGITKTSLSQGSEYLDDGIRMTEQPLAAKVGGSAEGGTILKVENSPYLIVQKGDRTFHISPDRVKEYVKNPLNPNSRWGDQVNFKNYGVPEGSEIIKGAGKGHKRTPTQGELNMFNEFFKK